MAVDNDRLMEFLGLFVGDLGATAAGGYVGASSVIIAQAYPASTIVGSDYHEASIELARKRAADAGVLERIAFEVASAQTFSGTGYDLVATFDCLHDMGDPLLPVRTQRTLATRRLRPRRSGWRGRDPAGRVHPVPPRR